MTPSPAGIRDVTNNGVGGRGPFQPIVDDRQVTQHFFDRRAGQRGIFRCLELRQLVGMLKECSIAERDHVRCGFVPGTQKEDAHLNRLSSLQFAR